MSRSSTPFARRVGLVLAGGGARAAYEVGVVDYLVHDVARAIGHDVPLDILCGTSAGAINACSLAAYADEPKQRADRLADRWRSLKIEQVLRFDVHEALTMALGVVGVRKPECRERPHGGLFKAEGLRQVLAQIPFERIGAQLRAGNLSAVSVSATHVGSGRTVVFAQQSRDTLPTSGDDTSVEPQAAALHLEHAFASAAIPFLFPGVSIDGELYCDGALRQNVPLSPAQRLGADALIVISPNSAGSAPEPPLATERERSYFGPAFLLGKTLNALLFDRIDGDVDRLNRINQILDAGVREYGTGFVEALNRQLGRREPASLRRLESVVIQPSQNISVIAEHFLTSPDFVAGGGVMRRLFRRFTGTSAEADLGSYLLFDGALTAELIELGRCDARAQHERLVDLFEGVLRSRDLRATAA